MSMQRRIVLVVAVGGAAVVAAAFVAACSSTAYVTGAVAGEDAASDAARPSPSPRRAPSPDPAISPKKDAGHGDAGEAGHGDAGDAGSPLDQCLAACDSAHPRSVAKEAAIDKCWQDRCNGPCVEQNEVFDAGSAQDGGADAGSAGLCGTDVGSDTESCSQCTTAHCCDVWQGCFSDSDCVAYDDCLTACFSGE